MKQFFRHFASALFICLLPVASKGQVGNDNPTGVAGDYNGSITTGGSFDPYTGNGKRVINDIVVTGSVGAYPLKWTRILNTRGGPGIFGQGGSWVHSYNWGMWIRPPGADYTPGQPDQYEGPDGQVSYPDGRTIDLTAVPGGTYVASTAMEPLDRVYDVGGGNYDLFLGDGGKIHFRPVSSSVGGVTQTSLMAQEIEDPYGQITTLTRDSSGKLIRVTEPAGRYLQINYSTVSYIWQPSGETISGDLITSVQAFDGRGNLMETVSYTYTQTNVSYYVYFYLTQVNYDDGTAATYTYGPSNNYNPSNPYQVGNMAFGLVQTCNDVRYAGPMSKIEYEYMPPYSMVHFGVAWGQIKREKNATTHQVLSEVTYPGYGEIDPGHRTETRGDGATRHLRYDRGELYEYTDFKNQTSFLGYSGATMPEPGFSHVFTDARGKTSWTEKQWISGAVRVVHHADGTSVRYDHWDQTNPFYVRYRTDERGNRTEYLRDNNHRVTRINYPDGSNEQFTYTPTFGQIETHTMTSGGVENFRYDARGRKYLSWPPATPSDPNPQDHPAHYNYYESGPNSDRLLNVVDPRGNATWYEYNLRGQVTKVTHQDGTFTQSGYNGDGTLAWTADENHPNASSNASERTRYTYDEYRRVLTVTNPMNQTTTISYALDANPLLHTTNSIKFVVSPMNKNVVFDYDANFRKIDQVAALGTADEAWTLFEYDEVGNLTKTTDPRWNETRFGYDDRNRKIWMDDPIPSDRNASGHTMNWAYDGVGNKRYETRADNGMQEWRYDSMNRLVEHYGFAGERVVRYDRNTEHTWEWITDAKGATYAISFDALHRKVYQHYPADTTRADPGEHFWYDAVGNLIQYKNPADQHQHFHYDSRNRRDHSWWDGSAGQDVVTSYDAASRLTNVTTNDGETSVSFGYDDANRKIWEEQTLAGYPTRHVQTDRDADGNRSGLSAPYFLVYYQYNQRNQLAHILDGNGNPFYDFGYDASGNLTHREVRWWDGNVTNYQYDPLNRVSMAEHGTNGWIFARSWYQYDIVSREVATWREEDNGMGGSRGERYWYDVTNQLSGVRYNANDVWTGNPSDWRHSSDYNYTPDRLNRTSKVEDGNSSSYTASALNQYGSINGQGVGYDGKFNVTSYNGATFTYNAQNQLTGGSMQATYDGLGRCVRRTTSSGTRLYTYDDWNPIIEWDQWGNFAGWNMYGARADEIVMRWDVALGPMVYKQDPHGNVVALLDQWGNIVERYIYDAFGKPRVTGFWDDNDRGGSLYGNRFMFQGREWIGELGIYDYRRRMYQPALGRFLQTDPTGFDAGDMNLFRYCGDDAVNQSDPTGLDSDVYLYREYADRNAPGTYVIYNDAHRQIYRGPANQNPFYANSHGVRAGDYTLQPKGDRWGRGRYPSNQPAITGSAPDLKPGQPNSSYRAPALVHKALPYRSGPDSQGCVTVAQEAVDKTKEIMAHDRKAGGTTRFHIRDGTPEPVRIRRAESLQNGPSSDNGGLGAGDSGKDTDYSRQRDQMISNYLMSAGDNSGEGFHPGGPR